MERPRRTTKPVDYRKFHLSGDLDQKLQGKVGQLVNNLEEMSTNQELQQELEAQVEARKKLEAQAEEHMIRHEMEMEKLKTAELELSIKHIKEAREKAHSSHQEKVQELTRIAKEVQDKTDKEATEWLHDQIKRLKGEATIEPRDPAAELRKQQEREKQEKINSLRKQLQELTGEPDTPTPQTEKQLDQQLLLQQLRTSLDKGSEDPQRDILRAMITGANKTQGVGGTSTLKPDILARLTGETPMEMQDWLAHLNQQEEGEFLAINREGDQEGKITKLKSGMLDKSTSNIKVKQVWPQKNLGEDWAEEELDFKQIRFEHLVAGETRTIETCTEPAQILGRLKLLRRIAYLKLRGFEWNMLRRMYSAILTSIETGENSWGIQF